MKKTLQLLLALFTFTFASAQDENHDGSYTIGDYNYTFTQDENESDQYLVAVVGFKTEAVTETVDGEEVTTYTPLSLENVVIPASVSFGGGDWPVDAIAANAFKVDINNDPPSEANRVITSVVIEGNVRSIEASAFESCSNLASVSLAETVTSLGSNLFKNCGALTTINTEYLTSIGAHCFRGTSVVSLDLSSLVTMGPNAINRASKLEEVKVPVLESFGNYNVYGNSSLETIYFSAAINSFAEQAFHTAPLKVIHIDDDVPFDLGLFDTADANKLFVNQITVVVPTDAGVTAYKAAANWDQFADIVSESDYNATASLVVGYKFTVDGIEYVITSNSESETPKNEVAVSGVSNSELTTISPTATVTNPETDETYDVVSVATDAFLGNTVITEVVLPASIKTLEKGCFQGASALTTINTENVTTINKDAFRSTGITTLDLSEVTTLTQDGLGRMYNLTGTISLPKLEILPPYAFVFAQGLTEVKLGAVTQVGVNSFFGLPSLTTIEITAQTPPTTGDETFVFGAGVNSDRADIDNDPSGVPDLFNVALKVSDVAAYEAANGWKDFVNTEVLSIEDILSGDLNIQVSAEALTVTSSSTFTNGSLNIYDITGRELSNTALNSASASVNISNLASGVYIVKVTEGNAKLVKRFVKQ